MSAKSQKPKAKSQKPKAKSQKPKAPWSRQSRHAICVQRDTKHIVWAWWPGKINSPPQPKALRYFLAGRYVAWVCADDYNEGTSTSDHQWQSCYHVFQQSDATRSGTGTLTLTVDR
ncbi:hypothetical protein [Pantoea allii]|uniref:hypothetical protein n=1 Tax=Pantoea allii TaxID=574096 RepID=UPI0024B6956E|nr:hypothetical protein [Pantoea allii]MDJ0039993.1 hypothetical protein [Pantoea allii]